MAFSFDRHSHTYRDGARVVPGITSVLRAAGCTDSEWVTEEALRRGTAVHAATLLLDLGDTPVLPLAWDGYLRAYVAFRRDIRCSWQEMEEPRISRLYGFAGTPDRVGLVAGRPALLELKTAQAASRVAWHGYQTAGQDLLMGGPRGVRQRLVAYLLPDGRYRLREYRDSGDYLAFLEALRSYDHNH